MSAEVEGSIVIRGCIDPEMADAGGAAVGPGCAAAGTGGSNGVDPAL